MVNTTYEDTDKIRINGSVEITDFEINEVVDNYYDLVFRIPENLAHLRQLELLTVDNVLVADYLLSVHLPDEVIFKFRLYVDNYVYPEERDNLNARLTEMETFHRIYPPNEWDDLPEKEQLALRIGVLEDRYRIPQVEVEKSFYKLVKIDESEVGENEL